MMLVQVMAIVETMSLAMERTAMVETMAGRELGSSKISKIQVVPTPTFSKILTETVTLMPKRY